MEIFPRALAKWSPSTVLFSPFFLFFHIVNRDDLRQHRNLINQEHK